MLYVAVDHVVVIALSTMGAVYTGCVGYLGARAIKPYLDPEVASMIPPNFFLSIFAGAIGASIPLIPWFFPGAVNVIGYSLAAEVALPMLLIGSLGVGVVTGVVLSRCILNA